MPPVPQCCQPLWISNSHVTGATTLRVAPWSPALKTRQRGIRLPTWLALTSRIIAALFGGYLLAALSSIAALALPIDGRQAVFVGMLISFLLYAGAVIWVFAVRSAWRAWFGLGMAALPLWLAAHIAIQGGTV